MLLVLYFYFYDDLQFYYFIFIDPLFDVIDLMLKLIVKSLKQIFKFLLNYFFLGMFVYIWPIIPFGDNFTFF